MEQGVNAGPGLGKSRGLMMKGEGGGEAFGADQCTRPDGGAGQLVHAVMAPTHPCSHALTPMMALASWFMRTYCAFATPPALPAAGDPRLRCCIRGALCMGCGAACTPHDTARQRQWS